MQCCKTTPAYNSGSQASIVICFYLTLSPLLCILLKYFQSQAMLFDPE